MEELTLTDYILIVRQRKSIFLTIFGVLFALSLIVALSWSNYRSTATIEIAQPQVAPEVTTPMGMNANNTPEALADLRVSKIQQKVTAPSSLVDIITKFDLYASKRKKEPVASVAGRMAEKIKLNLISSVIANPAATQKVSADQLSAIAFTLSFDYDDPQVAQSVTNELVTRFLDEDLKDRRNQAEATADFIQKQIALLEATMVEQEKNIAAFEAEHGVTRPETLMFNQQAAANVALSLQGLDSQIATNEGTQGALHAQMANVDPYTRVIADGQILTTPSIQLKALQAQYATLSAQYGPEHPDVLKVKHQMEALHVHIGTNQSVDTGMLRAQIDDVKTNLAAAKKNYGADNPDVVSLQHQLDKLNRQLAETRKGHSTINNIHQDADNPAYLELVSQLQAAETQHQTLLEQREKLAAQQEKYQQAVLQNPALQQQMAALTRDYDNAQIRFRELKEKKMAADMDKQMIEDRNGQHLVTISPPQLPQHTQPRRMLIVLAGFFASLIAGVAGVIVSQLISQSILGSRHLAAIVGVPPLVNIPHIVTAEDRAESVQQKAYDLAGDLIARHAPFLTALKQRF